MAFYSEIVTILEEFREDSGANLVTINLDCLSTDERAILKDLIEKAERGARRRRKPNLHENYWYVTDSGFVKSSVWEATVSDMFRASQGNCFLNKPDAEESLKSIAIKGAWRRMAEESWDGEDPSKSVERWYLAWYSNSNGFIQQHEPPVFIGVDYFKTAAQMWEALKIIGDDDVKRYVLGVS